ncbi:MAG: iron-sulfur cluster assembly scaffold protein [Thermoplasmata archaeon]
MYNDEIMDRYQNPSYFGKPEKYTIVIDEASTSCGDKIILYIQEENGVIKQIKFEGDGCIISMVSTDLFCEKATGRNIEEIMKIDESDYVKNFPVEITPGRLNCALLPIRAFRRGVGRSNISGKLK